MSYPRFAFGAALLLAGALTCPAVPSVGDRPTIPDAAVQAPPSAPEKFRDPKLPIPERVDDLLSRLTVEEKISEIGMYNAAVPRLGIPAYHWWNEGLHGVARNGIATVFPQAIGLAATWNPGLDGRIAAVVSTEARAKYHETLRTSPDNTDIYQGITIWSPNINIFRDPRWGRGQETYGEDPFLTGSMGVAFVRGIQGDDPRYLRALATLKHFAVHSGPEPERHRFDAVVSDRDLRETYLPAFEMGVRQGGALSVMSAYNAIDGVPAPGNTFLLHDVLRGEWGFDGAVVSDVGAVDDLHNTKGHHYTADGAAAIAAALKAGNDLCSDNTYKSLEEALARGLVTEADIDTALRRLFTLRFRLGMFDPPAQVPFAATPPSEVDSAAHDQLALEAARQSLVLLKNDGTLPWDAKQLRKVAILGPTGDDYLALIGNYAGTPSHPQTIVRALREKLEAAGVQVSYAPAVPLVAGFREAGQPIPEGVLFTDDTRQTPGLKRELFATDDLTGTPTSVGQDSQVDLFWTPAQPVPGLPVEGVNARWSGVLVPEKTGDYDLAISFIGAGQLFVDDRAVAGTEKQEHSVHNAALERTHNAALHLEAGHAYHVRLEYHERPGASLGRIQFGWRAPGSLDDALALARDADQVILTLGITPALEGEEMKVNVDGFNGGDRTSILLPKVQRDLLDAVAALGKPFVVVLCNGSCLSFDVSKPNAILEAWYYGQRGGEAVAEALLGEINPSGRLPITFYRDDADLPPFEDYAMAGRTYRYFGGKPLYAFGHGLSYTTFAYEKISPSKKAVRTGATVDVKVAVRNTGSRAGDEVVQLYATALNPPVPVPLRELVGFQRVTLKPGQKKTVTIAVPVERLRRWDADAHRYVVDPGAYKLVAGPASDQAALEATLTVKR